MSACTANVAGQDYADFIYRHSSATLEELSQTLHTDCISFVNESFAVYYVPLEEAMPLSLPNHSYDSIPSLFGLMDTTSMEASGILSTFRQPALGSNGEGVILGLIDTGIDYQNPLFRNPNGTTRILGLWDQTAEGGGFELPGNRPFLFPFLYGKEYREEEINQALFDDDPLSVVPATDTNGHGTFLAGIAAGGISVSPDFTGAAPQCSLGIVKLKPAKQYLRDYYMIPNGADAYESVDIMLGITYLTLLARRHRMPLVICLGLGANSGGHTGASPVGEVLNSLRSFLGVTAVCSAGNEAGLRHHYLGQINGPAGGSGDYDEVELRVGEQEKGMVIELWADSPEIYTVGFVSPTGEVIQRIPLSLNNETTVKFSLESTSIVVSYATALGSQGSFLASLRFISPIPGIWRIRVYPTIIFSGVYHMWLPIQGFVSPDTYFLQSDPYTTIVTPGNADFPITVSTYNHLDGSLYIHSSRGYTRDGRIKPDLAAPGVEVYGPGISSVPGEYPMIRMTGSSVAAAHVAGAAANIYSRQYPTGAYPIIGGDLVKSSLTRGANRNPNYIYPNKEWGYGTLNLYDSFLSLRE
ncbi:MAG: S8 family peptidase [Hungatella sp.]|jgi:subtilisin family serine protease|nr:S8 family peptidase [Hungatella sp.]MCI9501061.1 S8 family peptidase [Hungatella sp.]MCI9637117.1 S8 family peptidase [Hungatella sp.]